MTTTKPTPAAAPHEFWASVAINKEFPEGTDFDTIDSYDLFDYEERGFDNFRAARLWCGRISKSHPQAVGAANVNRRTWEFGECGWYITEEDSVWSM